MKMKCFRFDCENCKIEVDTTWYKTCPNCGYKLGVKGNDRSL